MNTTNSKLKNHLFKSNYVSIFSKINFWSVHKKLFETFSTTMSIRLGHLFIHLFLVNRMRLFWVLLIRRTNNNHLIFEYWQNKTEIVRNAMSVFAAAATIIFWHACCVHVLLLCSSFLFLWATNCSACYPSSSGPLFNVVLLYLWLYTW